MKEYIVRVKVVDNKRSQRDVECLIDDIINQGLKSFNVSDYGMIEVLLKGADYK